MIVRKLIRKCIFAFSNKAETSRFGTGVMRRLAPMGSELQWVRLEPRVLLAAANPSNFDVYMVELINLARANPSAYASSLGIALNEGLPAGTISTAAKQPLAINRFVTDAAQKHSQWMVDTDKFSHTGAGGSNPQSRMITAGYVFKSPSFWSENLGFKATSATPNVTTFTKNIEEGLFVDLGYAGRGHRLNILNETAVEIGIGIKTGIYKSLNAVMVTQDFAKSGTATFLTGVAYRDTVTADRFYTPGEGLGGISIVATRDGGGQTYRTTSWTSGGYTLALPAGRYSVMASGTALGASQFLPAVTIGTRNVKLDFVKGTVRVAPEVAVKGNGVSITNKDSTPSTADWTNFGATAVNGGTVTRQFTIHNLGNSALKLTGIPRVLVSGTHAADFVVTVPPLSIIAGGGSSIFTVRFDPKAAGTRTAKLSFVNSDGNENPFSFAISGTGTLQSQMPVYVEPLPVGNQHVSVLTNSVRKGLPRLEQIPDTVKVTTHPAIAENRQSNTTVRSNTLVSATTTRVKQLDEADAFFSNFESVV
jgi:uncharacterized protein YkwD